MIFRYKITTPNAAHVFDSDHELSDSEIDQYLVDNNDANPTWKIVDCEYVGEV